jgi:hypothetical protein
MQTIKEFIENNSDLNFDLVVKCIEDRPDVEKKDEWQPPEKEWEKPFNYEFTVKTRNGSYSGYYSKGIGHGKRTKKIQGNSLWAVNERKAVRKADQIDAKPTLSEILDSLAMDCSEFIWGIDFEEWATTLGYDTDSRKAEKIYQACQAEFNGLLRILGIDTLRELIEDTERE